MKRQLMLIIAISVFLCGCEKEPQQENGEVEETFPRIELTNVPNSQLLLLEEGGEVSIEYTVVNQVDGGEVSASVNKSWIENLDDSVEGSVTFDVQENMETEDRNAVITLTYNWAESSVETQVNVIQPGRTVSFDIQIPEDEVTAASARVITRCLDDMRWFDGLMRTSVIEEAPDFESLVLDDFVALVNMYAAQGFDIDDILYTAEHVDDYVWTGLSQKTAYTPYAFGMDLDYNFTSEIYVGPEFTTGEIEITDLTFDIVVEPKQTSAVLNITPSDQQAWYFATVIGDSFYEEGFTDEQIMEYLCNSYGKDLETYALTGTVNGREIIGMSPGEHYTAVAFGVDLDSYMYNSAMTSVDFYTTGSGETKAYATGNLDTYWEVEGIIREYPEYADLLRVDAGNPLLAAVVLDFNESTVGAHYSSWIGDVSAMGDMLFDATVQGTFYADKEGCVDFFYMNYTAASTFCVVAVDADGNFGDMYMEVTHRTEDGVSTDYALFDEYYRQSHASVPKASVLFSVPERPVYTLKVSTAPDKSKMLVRELGR